MHLGALKNDFVFDDVPAIVENPLVDGSSDASAFTSNFWGARRGFEHVTTYRPLTTLSFRLTHALFGPGPTAFHSTNLVLHALVSALVVGLLWTWFGRMREARIGAAVGGMLFAVLPVHVEAIAGAVNRAELQSTALVLLSLIAWGRATVVDGWRRNARYGVAIAAFAAAALSKEQAITTPAVVVLFELMRRAQAGDAPPPIPRWPLVALVLVAVGVVAARAAVLPAILGGDVPPLDNPLAHTDALTRLRTVPKLLFESLRLLFAPHRLTADWSAHAIPLTTTWSDADSWAGLVLGAGGLALLVGAVRTRQVPLAMLLAWFFGQWALIGSVFFPSTILLAERVLYLPSVPVVMLVGLVVGIVHDRLAFPAMRLNLLAAVVLIVALFAGRSIQRVADWHDGLSLFASAVRVAPDSARARMNLAIELRARGAFEEAEDHARAALALVPDDPDALVGLAEVRVDRGLAGEAVALARRSMARRPSRAGIRVLCRALGTQGDDAPGTVDACGLAVREWPRDPMVHHLLGRALLAVGKRSEAVAALETALACAPGHAAITADLARARAP